MPARHFLLRADPRRRPASAVVALVVILCGGNLLQAQTSSFESKSGEELYRAACAACHGADGKGHPPSIVGFDTPLPDFTDCSFATPEPDADWLAIAHEGGPVRAFDRRMPAFGQALSEAALLRVIGYLRGFCSSRSWPRGELNLPRPLLTEKAFPENETVLSVSIAGGDEAAVGPTVIYERRVGARSQLELAVRVDLQKDGAAGWRRGLGDVVIAFKHALFHRLDTGTILSVAGEAAFPTGKPRTGLGNGATILEPFVAVGQILGTNGFLQLQTGAAFPVDRDKADQELFIRMAIGRSFMERGFGRTWSPMIEVAGARELVGTGAHIQWDLVPEMQVTLSKRQHIMVSGGVRIPLADRREGGLQVLTYLLWDWFDGGFFDGWR